jgi:hypothetical protein
MMAKMTIITTTMIAMFLLFIESLHERGGRDNLAPHDNKMAKTCGRSKTGCSGRVKRSPAMCQLTLKNCKVRASGTPS